MKRLLSLLIIMTTSTFLFADIMFMQNLEPGFSFAIEHEKFTPKDVNYTIFEPRINIQTSASLLFGLNSNKDEQDFDFEKKHFYAGLDVGLDVIFASLTLAAAGAVSFPLYQTEKSNYELLADFGIGTAIGYYRGLKFSGYAGYVGATLLKFNKARKGFYYGIGIKDRTLIQLMESDSYDLNSYMHLNVVLGMIK